MTRSPLRALVGVLLAAGVIAALLTAPASASAGATDATGATVATGAGATRSAPADRPRVGSCHALSWAEFLRDSDPDRAVPCARTHTSRTFAVRTAPAGVDLGDVASVSRFADGFCGPAWTRAISRDIRKRLLSAYTAYGIFVPTAAQQRAGARWVRCDIVLFGGRNQLAPLPRRVRTPAIRSLNPPDAEARCLTRSAYITVCSRPHAYRATTAYKMPGRAYPSDRAFAQVAGRRCRAAAQARRYTYVPPSPDAWRAGFRHVVCYDLTAR